MTQASHPVPRASARAALPRPRGRVSAATFGERLVLVWWTLVLTSAHWFLAGFGLTPLAKLPSLLLGVCGLVVVVKRFPTQFAPPMLAWLAVSAAATFLASNRIYAFQYFKPVVFSYAIAVITVALLHTARQTLPLLRIAFVGQFLWLAFFGVRRGLVSWHPDLANADGFGPIMVIGMGMAFFYGAAAKQPRERYLGWGTAVLCLGGVVSSFARGAVLSAAAVAAYIWWVMPNKRRSTLALLAGGLIVVVAAALLGGQKRGGNDSSPTGFWAEMMTIGDSEDGTTSDRKILWSAALRVFSEHPVIGAGPANFGVVASTLYQPGEIGGEYSINPLRLYDRALHSSYLQILSEQGLLGCIAFIWMLVDFARRNRKMRTQRFREAWAKEGADLPDLRLLAVGLEAGLLGFLTTAAFYNQLYVHWLYSILAVNLMLHTVSGRLWSRHSRASGAVRLNGVGGPHIALAGAKL